MKCWKSAFNAQGSRLIIVALQVVMETLKKKERQGETQFTTKIEVPPPLNANIYIYIYFESHPIYDQIQGFNVVFLIL